ncbi:MAG: hypothetical protein U1C74_12370 [Phenylobacterium sp.]|nr:hypothetical protein [Phenylobacterium sp.]
MIPPRFERAEGLTASERILAEIADRSFLKLWTYPNPFREPNRELCDLIVVFGDDVLLFSDKAGAYPDTGNSALDWSRYYRSAIAESAQQLRTAENWIQRFPDRVFLDVRCQTLLPLALPLAARLRVHRICVAPAATDAARDRGGQTGLAIVPAVAGDERPYTVGQVAGCQGWVHVFDEESITVVLPTLSTIRDFVAYLRAKEALIAAGGLTSAASEKDLLAAYLWANRSFPDQGSPLIVEAGTWQALAAQPQFQAAQALNRRGDLWDRLIERLTAAVVQRQAVFGNDLEMTDVERILRHVAGEDRFERRVLSGAILERAQRAVGGGIGSILPSHADPSLAYVLWIKDHDPRQPYEAYRERRAVETLMRVQSAAAIQPELATVIGLGLDAANGRGGSEDFIYLDATAVSAEDRTQWAETRQVMGHFLNENVEQNRLIKDEYPPLA